MKELQHVSHKLLPLVICAVRVSRDALDCRPGAAEFSLSPTRWFGLGVCSESASVSVSVSMSVCWRCLCICI